MIGNVTRIFAFFGKNTIDKQNNFPYYCPIKDGELVKSPFSPPLAGGDEGEGEKTGLNPAIFHPRFHPNSSPVKGEGILDFLRIRQGCERACCRVSSPMLAEIIP